MDIELKKTQINGMIERGKLLRADEIMFIKFQGINETIIKKELSRGKDIKSLEAEKENKKELLAKKTAAVSSASKKIVDKMNEVLPEKNAVFSCADGLVMGLENEDGSTTTYNGLSGGELQVFNSALSNVLDANILIIEGAEIDQGRLITLMEDLQGSDKQVVINTCHAPVACPEIFRMVEL